MAIGDIKQDVKLGKTRYDNIKNTDDNFTSLFDTVDDLNMAIGDKEDSIGEKGSAFNQNFETSSGNIKMNGAASVGSSSNIPRADHVHPTDTTRLAVKPDGSNLLIDSSSNKINTAYLPDSILGQLYYQGVWAPSSGGTSPTSPDAATTDPQRGDYYIAGDSGNYNPEQETVSGVSYSTGDWAVYNGNSWDKVDNTDAVTMVNGQIGAVKTYKGTYSADVSYYNGDIVLLDDCLYLCIIASGTSKGVEPTNTTNWKIFGRIYDSLKNPFGLRLILDGSNYDYDGSAALQVEITPAAIGAATSGHTHSYLPLSGGTITGNVTFNAGKALQLNTLKLPTASGGTTYGAGSSGQVLKSNGTTVYWGTDNNTTYSAMTGATASAAGTQGLVPAPTAGKQSQFLRGDGTWAVPNIAKTYSKFTTSSFAESVDSGGLYLYATELSSDDISILRIYKGNDIDGYKEADVMIGITKQTDGSGTYTIYTDEKFEGMIEYISHSAS